MSALSTAPAEAPDKVRKAKRRAKTKKSQAKAKAKPKKAPPIVVVHSQTHSTNKPPMKLLREREVLARLGLRQTRFKEMVEAGDFPSPVHITPGGRALGYVESEVEAYIASRIKARDEDAA